MISKKTKPRTYLIYGIVMVLLCFFCCSTIAAYPFFDILSPVKIDNLSQISEIPDNRYITVTVDNLYYTGFDYVHNNKVRAHYYYSLNDHNCTFFLIEADENSQAEQELSDITITGKINKDTDLITNLTASFAKQIDWTSDGLSKLTSPFLICQVPASPVKTILLFVSLIIFLLLTLASSIIYFKKFFKNRKLMYSIH